MADLHPLELVTVLGAAVAAVLALVAPISRARLVAAWVLVGFASAAIIIAGPTPAMYPAYLLALLLALMAWIASRRVSSAPLRAVWRTGRGQGAEHVTAPAGAVRLVGRVLLFVFCLVLLAFPLQLLPLPGSLG